MNALLSTLVYGLVAQAAIRANGSLGRRSAPERKMELNDSELRTLTELLGRPLTQQEVEELDSDDSECGDGWRSVSSYLWDAYLDTPEAADASEAIEQATSLERRANRAEAERDLAMERARQAEREIESLRADVAWLKRALCERASRDHAATGAPRALVKLDADRKAAQDRALALRLAVSNIGHELFERADSLRAKVSNHGHEVGPRKAYRSQRTVRDDEVRAETLESVCRQLTELVTPARRVA
jgi:hypothetical protein